MTDEQIKQSVIETQSLCKQNAADIEKLTKTMTGIVEKLDAKTSTNWSVIWSALGVVAMIVIPLVTVLSLFSEAKINAIREVVTTFSGESDKRIYRLETLVDRDREAKSRLWDNYIYDQVTNGR